MTVSRRSLSSEDMKRLEDMVAASPVLENAFRLMVDGDCLFRNERYASVVSLAVLSLEEIGKYLLDLWSRDAAFAYDRKRLHQAKQRAVAALFTSDRMRIESRKRNVDFSNLEAPGQMELLAEAIKVGAEMENTFSGSVESGVMQHVKHSGLYYDEDFAGKGIEPSKIKAEHADEFMRKCSRAFMALTEPKTVGLAADIFMLIQSKKTQAGKG